MHLISSLAWINRERTLLDLEEHVKSLQDNYGPAEFQNPDKHLCRIYQTSSKQDIIKNLQNVHLKSQIGQIKVS